MSKLKPRSSLCASHSWLATRDIPPNHLLPRGPAWWHSATAPVTDSMLWQTDSPCDRQTVPVTDGLWQTDSPCDWQTNRQTAPVTDSALDFPLLGLLFSHFLSETHFRTHQDKESFCIPLKNTPCGGLSCERPEEPLRSSTSAWGGPGCVRLRWRREGRDTVRSVQGERVDTERVNSADLVSDSERFS